MVAYPAKLWNDEHAKWVKCVSIANVENYFKIDCTGDKTFQLSHANWDFEQICNRHCVVQIDSTREYVVIFQ